MAACAAGANVATLRDGVDEARGDALALAVFGEGASAWPLQEEFQDRFRPSWGPKGSLPYGRPRGSDMETKRRLELKMAPPSFLQTAPRILMIFVNILLRKL